MTLAVLDTDMVTLLRCGNPNVVRWVAERSSAELGMTIVTVEELLAGWYAQIRQARSDEKLERAYRALRLTVAFCAGTRILDFDAVAIRRFHALRGLHRRIGTNDLRIAAIVLEHRAVLITRNVGDFAGIEGLDLEDWSVP
jgi:predicted nucleic acid-binding protein